MMKLRRKLVLRSQTLRTLANADLERVIAGGDSSNTQCAGAADSGAAACPTGVAVSPTKACG